MKTRLRIQQIVIDIPRSESEPWVSFTVQKIEMDDDYKTLNVVDRWRSLNRRMSEFATNIVHYEDLLSPPSGHISGAGLGNAITGMAMMLVAREYGGTIDSNGYIMVN